MKLYAIAMIWYVFGLLIAALWAEYSLWGWNEAYWIWTKGNDLLLLMVVWQRPINTPGIGMLISFAVSRLLLELVVIFTGWNVNNTWLIRILFILYLVISLVWLLKELHKWRRSNWG